MCTDDAKPDASDLGAWYWGADTVKISPTTFGLRVDTRSRGWNDLALLDTVYTWLQNKRCDVIFAHSMGNVILSQLVVARGKAIKWYMVAGPLRGSWAASQTSSWCGEGFPIANLVSAVGYCYPTISSLAVVGSRCYVSSCVPGVCPDSNNRGVSSSWSGGNHWQNDAADCWYGIVWSNFAENCCDSGKFKVTNSYTNDGVSASNILGRACGTSGYGLGGVHGDALYAISGISFYGEDSDGMVGLSSCAPIDAYLGQTLSSDPNSPNFKGALNHEDIRGSNGDGAGGDQKIVQWYRNMIARGSLGACPLGAGTCSNP